jgi:hypothetical protein
MKFLFDDDSFSFETLRAAGFATYGGADLGEVLVTAEAITNGDEASWHQAWKATAERVQAIGDRSLAAGHPVSARRLHNSRLSSAPVAEAIACPVAPSCQDIVRRWHPMRPGSTGPGTGRPHRAEPLLRTRCGFQRGARAQSCERC